MLLLFGASAVALAVFGIDIDQGSIDCPVLFPSVVFVICISFYRTRRFGCLFCKFGECRAAAQLVGCTALDDQSVEAGFAVSCLVEGDRPAPVKLGTGRAKRQRPTRKMCLCKKQFTMRQSGCLIGGSLGRAWISDASVACSMKQRPKCTCVELIGGVNFLPVADCPRQYAASGKNQAGGSNIFATSHPAVTSPIEMRG